jgi:transcriptional regulator with XRE-family HTH domain
MNRGAEALRAALTERGAQQRLSEKLNVDPGAVSRWLKGELKPGVSHRRSLEDDFGISWRLWDEEADEEVPSTERAPHG